jgi:hypothetical protein
MMPKPQPEEGDPALGLTEVDRNELVEAQKRIPKKWRAFDRMMRDYAAADHLLRRS